MKTKLHKIKAMILARFNRMFSFMTISITQRWHIEHWIHFHVLEDGTIERCYTPHDQCRRPHISMLQHAADYINLVPTVMRNEYLDATLKTGQSSPVWYVGLVDNSGFSTYAAGDIMSSHAGWTESVAYSNATRPVWTPGTISAGSVDNSGSVAVFNINGTATIRGGFLVDESTKGGSTGTLGGEADFTGGSRSVVPGDTLNVTVTCSIASA
ncbi:MAG: hypothetical protein JW730_18250 [Anaerolineales bacterium]|nr:hypothetical protein [Anaerolineales bacterium]